MIASISPWSLFERRSELFVFRRSSQLRDGKIVSNISSLLTLDLSGNQLTSLTEVDLFGFINLQTLYLSRNPFTIFPSGVSSLTSLQSLYLDDAMISNIEADAFANMTSLRLVSLSGNPLQCYFDSWPLTILKMPAGLQNCNLMTLPTSTNSTGSTNFTSVPHGGSTGSVLYGSIGGAAAVLMIIAIVARRQKEPIHNQIQRIQKLLHRRSSSLHGQPGCKEDPPAAHDYDIERGEGRGGAEPESFGEAKPGDACDPNTEGIPDESCDEHPDRGPFQEGGFVSKTRSSRMKRELFYWPRLKPSALDPAQSLGDTETEGSNAEHNGGFSDVLRSWLTREHAPPAVRRSEQAVTITMELGFLSACVQDTHSHFQPLEFTREVLYSQSSESSPPPEADSTRGDGNLDGVVPIAVRRGDDSGVELREGRVELECRPGKGPGAASLHAQRRLPRLREEPGTKEVEDRMRQVKKLIRVERKASITQYVELLEWKGYGRSESAVDGYAMKTLNGGSLIHFLAE
eukprot:757994-Hanusia_phi.AAC.1